MSREEVLQESIRLLVVQLDAQKKVIAAQQATIRYISNVLGPDVPASVTDQGARWEWKEALDAATRGMGLTS